MRRGRKLAVDIKKLYHYFRYKYNSFRYKNSKLVHYAKNVLRHCVPHFLLKGEVEKAEASFAALPRHDQDYVRTRVDYYNKLDVPRANCKKHVTEPVSDNEMKNSWIHGNTTNTLDRVALRDFKLPPRHRRGFEKDYFIDLYEYTRFFPNDLEITYQFGDVTDVKPVPAIVKSRPIRGDNANSVLMNLTKRRHFLFIKDKNRFQDKKDMLVGRRWVARPHHIKFWEMYFDHPLCDLGWTEPPKSGIPAERIRWVKPFLTIGEHLKFKFILSLEGNDVATNLKWVMSSNSLAVMPSPTYETWFMEGRLIPNHHYVEIRSDYADLEERLNYYIDHPEESLRIIENAHRYVAQFQNRKLEDLISLLVLKKYFESTAAASS